MVDLNIHSRLSLCGSLEMSPKNIVEKAKSIGLNLISIEDHNFIANSIITQKLANRYEIYFLFGMEVQNEEEISCFYYFDNKKIRKILEMFLFKKNISILNLILRRLIMKLEDLRKIREKVKDEMRLREGQARIKVVIGMGTSSIAAKSKRNFKSFFR